MYIRYISVLRYVLLISWYQFHRSLEILLFFNITASYSKFCDKTGKMWGKKKPYTRKKLILQKTWLWTSTKRMCSCIRLLHSKAVGRCFSHPKGDHVIVPARNGFRAELERKTRKGLVANVGRRKEAWGCSKPKTEKSSVSPCNNLQCPSNATVSVPLKIHCLKMRRDSLRNHLSTSCWSSALLSPSLSAMNLLPYFILFSSLQIRVLRIFSAAEPRRHAYLYWGYRRKLQPIKDSFVEGSQLE